MRELIAIPVAVILSAALTVSCGDSGDAGSDGSGGAGGAASTSGSTGGAACDPLPTSGSSGGASSGQGSGVGVTVGEGGGIDLGAGGNAGPPPGGRLKCFDPEAGVGFDCSKSGGECCEKKDVCWNPETEPTFCDHPYCSR